MPSLVSWSQFFSLPSRIDCLHSMTLEASVHRHIYLVCGQPGLLSPFVFAFFPAPFCCRSSVSEDNFSSGLSPDVPQVQG